MDLKESCKVYHTDLPGILPAAPSAPTLVVEGRVAVYSVVASCYRTGSDAQQNAQPYILCGSSDATDILYQFVPIKSFVLACGGTRSFEMGGNGILFPDGLYIGRSQFAGDGVTAPLNTCITLSIFYTGGKNA